MADWTRDDIARLLTLLERIAAALEGRSGAPALGGSAELPRSVGEAPEVPRRDRERRPGGRTVRTQRELGG